MWDFKSFSKRLRIEDFQSFDKGFGFLDFLDLIEDFFQPMNLGFKNFEIWREWFPAKFAKR